MDLLKNYRVKEYLTKKGINPYRTWLDSLRDVKIWARIQARILRLELGSLGDYRYIGKGVNELRLDFGSGYRVYFGLDGNTLIILLLAGDKSSQRRDIIKAKRFWEDYLEDSK